MSIICKYCLTTFKTQSSLDSHLNNEVCKNKLCKHCDKTFTHKTNYYRHLKTCKIKKEQDEIQQKDNLICELKSKEKDLIIIKLQKKIDKMNNENKNTIKLNNFGREDIDHITKDKWIKIFEQYYNIYLYLLDLIYLKNPNNRNIYIPEEKSKYGFILKKEAEKFNEYI